MIKNVLDGENNKMYVLTIENLDAEETYTLSVTTVWTLSDGTTVEGTIAKIFTPKPWVT